MTKYESPVSHQYHKNTGCPKTYLETPFKFFRQKIRRLRDNRSFWTLESYKLYHKRDS